jgi:hypothetical protein
MNLLARWPLAVLCGLISVLAIIYNWSVVLRFCFAKRRGSQVPILGVLFGLLSFWLVPIPVRRVWWLLPVVVDPSSLALSVYCLSSVFRRPQPSA